MKLKLGRDPNRLGAKHPLILEELLALAQTGKQITVATVIAMLEDLHRQGLSSPYLVKLKGSPLWELKPNSRGGEQGGSRVYLFLLPTGEAGIVNCEGKEPDAKTSQAKLVTALRLMKAYKDGIPIFEEPQ